MSIAELEQPQTTNQPASQNASHGNPNANIFERAVCLSLEIGKPGKSKKGNIDAIQTDADKDVLKLSKTIFDGPEWAAILAVDTALHNYLNPANGVCLESKILRGGMHLVPIDLIESVDAKLQEFATERADRVTKFMAVYDDMVEAAKDRLKSQYNPADYPRADAVREKFYLQHEYVTLGVPGKLKAVSAHIFQQEKDKAEQKWREAAGEIQVALRQAMSDLVGYMVDRLTPKPDGSRKILREEGVEKLTKFIETFKARNITDDAELQTLVEQARQIIDGRDVESLRKNDALRSELAGQFSELKTTLDGMLATAPRRRIRLTDDE